MHLLTLKPWNPVALDATVETPRWMASSKAACWPGWIRMSAISRIIGAPGDGRQLSYSRRDAIGTALDFVTAEPEASFTSAGVRRGMLLSQPLTPGILLYAMVFGVLASERGLH